MSQPIRIGPLLTDSLKLIHYTCINTWGTGTILVPGTRTVLVPGRPTTNRSDSWHGNRSGSSNASTFPLCRPTDLTYLILIPHIIKHITS